MDNNNTIYNHDPVPAGEFKSNENLRSIDEINEEFYRIVTGEFTDSPEPEEMPQASPLDEFHLINHAFILMRSEAVQQKTERFSVLTNALGLVGIKRPVALESKISRELLQKEALLSQQLFENQEARPDNETWQFINSHGDWFWIRTRNGEKEPYMVTHYFVNEDGTQLGMVESMTDNSRGSISGVVPPESVPAVIEHMRLHMELVERHLYASAKPRRTKSRKH